MKFFHNNVIELYYKNKVSGIKVLLGFHFAVFCMIIKFLIIITLEFVSCVFLWLSLVRFCIIFIFKWYIWNLLKVVHKKGSLRKKSRNVTFLRLKHSSYIPAYNYKNKGRKEISTQNSDFLFFLTQEILQSSQIFTSNAVGRWFSEL